MSLSKAAEATPVKSSNSSPRYNRNPKPAIVKSARKVQVSPPQYKDEVDLDAVEADLQRVIQELDQKADIEVKDEKR